MDEKNFLFPKKNPISYEKNFLISYEKNSYFQKIGKKCPIS